MPLIFTTSEPWFSLHGRGEAVFDRAATPFTFLGSSGSKYLGARSALCEDRMVIMDSISDISRSVTLGRKLGTFPDGGWIVFR
jgi:hypothetical protein